MTVVFLTTVFMVRNFAERDSVPIVQGNGGSAMFRHMFEGKFYLIERYC